MTAGIILAAGLSRRMGTPKLLLEVNGAAIIQSVLNAALEANLHEVILVTSPVGMAGMVPKDPKLSLCENGCAASGMASSIVAGLRRVSSSCSGVMILLGDQPFIRTEIINALLAIFAGDNRRIVVPTVGGRRTTPVIFPSSLFADLSRISGDMGGRKIIETNPHLVIEVDMTGWYDDDDLDCPDDFTRIKAKMENSVRS